MSFMIKKLCPDFFQAALPVPLRSCWFVACNFIPIENINDMIPASYYPQLSYCLICYLGLCLESWVILKCIPTQNMQYVDIWHSNLSIYYTNLTTVKLSITSDKKNLYVQNLYRAIEMLNYVMVSLYIWCSYHATQTHF